MIINNFSINRAIKLSKKIIPEILEPVNIKILWLQCINFRKISSYFNSKQHKHTFYEIHFILDGSGAFIDSNNKEYPVNAGEAIIIPSNLAHNFAYKSDVPTRFSLAFTLPEKINPPKVLCDFTTIKLHDSIIENINTIFAEADKNTVFSLYVMRNCLFEILYEILNLEEYIGALFAPDITHNNLYINKAKKYVKDNLNIILTCKDVANYCNINEVHLNRLFKKHTNENLHAYIQRKKIEYSIELLKNKDLSLSAISNMLGFQNEYYFNTYFKKKTGFPPGTYRNNLKTR